LEALRPRKILAELRERRAASPAIDSLHQGLRNHQDRGAFPSDEAAMKLLLLALRNIGVHWNPANEWRAAHAAFAVFFSDRLPTTIR